MKTKTFFRMAALAFVGACIAACSGDNEQNDISQPDGKYTLTGTISLGGTQTRAVEDGGHTYWATGEEIKIFYQTGTGWASVIAKMGRDGGTDISGNFRFSVSIDHIPVHGGEVRVVYPASVSYDPVAGTYSTVWLENQDGSLESVSTYLDIAIGSSSMNVNDTEATVVNVVPLDNQLCICKLTLQDSAGELINASSLVINDGTNNYYVNPTSARSEFFVAMKPVTNGSFTFTAYEGSNTDNPAFTTAKGTLQASYFYTNTLILTKPVDLGLPSGTKWADMNLGASNDADYGLYYAWAETDGWRGEDWIPVKLNYQYKYKWRTSEDYLIYTKYNSTDGLVLLQDDDDAATVSLGSNWSTPTVSDMHELQCTQPTYNGSDKISGYTWEWISDTPGYKNSGHAGYKITAPNGSVIFLPAAGSCSYGGLNGETNPKELNKNGVFWTENLLQNDAYTQACVLSFSSSGVQDASHMRIYGATVRAVYKPQQP